MTSMATLTIFRYDPDSDEPPTYQDYRVPLTESLTVIRALFHLAEEADDPPAFRRFMCNRGQCASCVMTIDGRTRRACTTLVRDGLVLEPLHDYPVIKDLVVDFGVKVPAGDGGYHLVRKGGLVLDSTAVQRKALTGPWVRMTIDQAKCDSCDGKDCVRACWVNQIGHLEDRSGRRLPPWSAPIRLKDGRAEPAGVCNLCQTRPCRAKCPAEAFQTVAKGAGSRILTKRCIGCGLCLTACRQSNIWLNIERGHAVKCDLCGGDPACARACPFGAIDFRLVGQDGS